MVHAITYNIYLLCNHKGTPQGQALILIAPDDFQHQSPEVPHFKMELPVDHNIRKKSSSKLSISGHLLGFRIYLDVCILLCEYFKSHNYQGFIKKETYENIFFSKQNIGSSMGAH